MVEHTQTNRRQQSTNWLYVLIMSRTRFKMNPQSIVTWMPRNSLLEADTKSEVYLQLDLTGFKFK